MPHRNIRHAPLTSLKTMLIKIGAENDQAKPPERHFGGLKCRPGVPRIRTSGPFRIGLSFISVGSSSGEFHIDSPGGRRS